MLNYDTYSSLLRDASACSSADDFLIKYGACLYCSADMLTSACDIIYAVSHEDWKGIVRLSGCKMTVFSRKYGIPYSSLQKWATCNDTCKHIPPIYVLQLIGYALIAELLS